MKTALPFLLWILFILPAFAAGECLILTTEGRKINPVSITAKSNGDLEYVLPKNAQKIRIAQTSYRYAWVPKPADVTEADAKFKSGDAKAAAELYRKAYQNYRSLGWNIYCMRMEAEALAKLGMTADAVTKLEELRNTRILNPEQEDDYYRGLDRLASFYIGQNKLKEAEDLLSRTEQSRNNDLASSAFLRRGDILIRRGKHKEALYEYFQAALLFPKSPKHPEALFRTWETLHTLKDARAEKFAKRLREEYPADPFTKQLK